MHCVHAWLLLVVCGAASSYHLQEKQTDFGLRVFSQVAKTAAGKNLVFSPYGVSSVLGMVQLGAAGNTLKTMNTKMGFSLLARGAARVQRSMQRALNNSKGVQLASGVMVPRNLVLERGFRKRLGEAFFQGTPNQVDFSRPQEALKVINKWVAEKTGGNIRELIQGGAITQDTRLVLLNAIHFRGLWQVPFNINQTEERMFRLANRSVVPVPMMVLTNIFNYNDFVSPSGVDYEVIEVPYAGDKLSMLLVYPFDSEVLLSTLTKDLTSRSLLQWRQKLRKVNRRLVLPRFTLETHLELKAPLTSLGLGNLFEQDKANFSRISANEALYISKVVQKVKLEVNEEGTEGSSGTAAIMFSRMAIEEIIFDHPFLFLIQHKPTGAVLFMGEVNQPQSH